MSRSTIPSPAHAAGDQLHGFRIDGVTEIPDIKALAYEASHERTGARVLHVHCNDEENMFSVGFRTPPPDSTGVAHILEHSVLAGSEKYPVRDAFKELMKRTLNTFLNAMTWPDRTVYPTCSAVRADYFNLASVYVDLVFHPLITRQTFMQEGHHLEFEDGDPEKPLMVTGVVYNEMKGAYSSPEDVVHRQLRRRLMPDTPYGLDSGGDPEVMPDLTYEQFVAFHQKYYSPSNSRFIFYGDLTLAENLGFLETVLAPFERVEVDSRLPLQPRWEKPRSASLSYPVGPEDTTDGKSFVCMAWLMNESTDVQTSLALEIATDALVGSSAAPLRKALIDSGLGQDIFPAGYSDDARQASAMIGLRGTEVSKAGEIEALVMQTLQQVAREGLDAELIEGSMHQIEFSGKEISPPFPVWILVRAQAPWYADGDPKWGLQFSQLVEQTRASYAADPRYFDKLIQQWFVDNPHRLLLSVAPSTTLAAERDQAFTERMAAQKAALSAEQIAAIQSEAEALKAAQQAGDSAESLAKLPTLSTQDIPAEVREIPTEIRRADGVQVLEHEVFSNGVGYVGLAFDTRDLDDELSIALPLLGRLTCGMGAAGMNYEALSKRISSTTGGLGTGTMGGRHIHSGESYERFTLDGKALLRNGAELTELLRDVMLTPETGDLKRAGDLIQQAASRASSGMIPGGHMIALLRATASLDQSFWRREQWEGASQVRYLNQLSEQVESSAASLLETVMRLQAQLFTRSRLMVNVVGDPEVLEAFRPQVDALIAALPAGDPVSQRVAESPEMPRDVGIVIPAEVNYVTQALSVPNLADPSAPALNMLANILAADYLYKKLRVQGGAYGGMSFYMAEAGVLGMLSYRDPHLTETLEVYAGVLDYVREALDDEAVDASRIGAIGKADRILAPGQQLDCARRWHLNGVTTADRTQYRGGLLSVTAEQIRQRAVPCLERALPTAPRAVVASKERLEQANETLEEPFALFFTE